MPSNLLEVEDVVKTFVLRSPMTRKVVSSTEALRSVSLRVPAGKVVGLVGESGSGKTTLARCILGLESVTSGAIRFDGADQDFRTLAARRSYWRRVQLVAQNPRASLSPRLSAVQIVSEPVIVNKLVKGTGAARSLALEMMERVGLDPSHADKRPADLSGGQLQRLAIARALVLEPDLIILDEPTSALDVSVQAQILNLLRALQEDSGVSFLFISHDLASVANICDDVVVLYSGRVMEYGAAEQVLQRPQNPYTQALAISSYSNVRNQSAGRVIAALDGDSSGGPIVRNACPFAQRCAYANERCFSELPELLPRYDGRSVACHGVQEERVPELDVTQFQNS